MIFLTAADQPPSDVLWRGHFRFRFFHGTQRHTVSEVHGKTRPNHFMYDSPALLRRVRAVWWVRCLLLFVVKHPYHNVLFVCRHHALNVVDHEGFQLNHIVRHGLKMASERSLSSNFNDSCLSRLWVTTKIFCSIPLDHRNHDSL